MNNTEEYLEEIRKLNGLQNAILDGILVDKRAMTAEFSLITDKTYTSAEADEAETITKRFLPDDFSPKVKITKRVADEEGLQRRIYDFMCKRFPAAAAFLQPEDIQVEKGKSGANFCFDIAAGEQSLFTSGNILDEVSRYLSSIYCGAFYGNVRVVEKAEEEELDEELPVEEEEHQLAIRHFPITNFKKLDGVDELPKTATYIADSDAVKGDLTVCGAITFIQEREYVKHNEKTGTDDKKSRFSLTVADPSGSMRVTYFPKKATVDKVRALKAGDWVVLSGANEVYNDNFSYTARRINFGCPPEGFVPEARQGLPVPAAYHTVFPEEYADYTQSGFFDSLNKPDDLKKNDFVVYDLETTGLNSQPSMGKMDRIIELGAVKLKGGNVVEKFSSFVACPEKLTPKITELTGISDDDLVGAPTVDKVIADFYKFCDGCILVGHNNIQFDSKFVRYYGEQSHYMFEHKQYDTLPLAQELLRGEVGNYKLNTLADHYGITFNHHRAFDDALATAKIFIELMKKRKRLP